MTPEEKRIAIAEFCGKDTKKCVSWRSTWEGIPDYLNDLNAMHKAEEKLLCINGASQNTQSRWFIYLQSYGDIAGIHATAEQRADALLRTIGKLK